MSGYWVHVMRESSYPHTRVFDQIAHTYISALMEQEMYDDEGRQIVFGANVIGMLPQVGQANFSERLCNQDFHVYLLGRADQSQSGFITRPVSNLG